MKKGIIIVLLLIVFGTMGYFVYSMYTETKDLKNQINELKTKENEQNNKSDNTTTTTCDYKAISFDKTKCINCDLSSDNIELHIWPEADNLNGITIYNSQNNRKALDFDINWRNINIDYCADKSYDSHTFCGDRITVVFDKNVEMVFAGVHDMEGDEWVYYILLEDGTVEQMRLSDIRNKNFKHEKVQGVSDVVRFSNYSYGYKDIPEGPAGGDYGVIAYRMDGTYYDLKY